MEITSWNITVLTGDPLVFHHIVLLHGIEPKVWHLALLNKDSHLYYILVHSACCCASHISLPGAGGEMLAMSQLLQTAASHTNLS